MATTFNFKKNKNEEYKKLSLALKKVEKICRDNMIPFFFTVNISAENGNPEYESLIMSPHTIGMEIKEDLIRKHALLQSKSYDIALAVHAPIFEDEE